MPYNRPGRSVKVQNTEISGTLTHGQPVSEGSFTGVAVKQLAPGWDSVVADATTIADDENYLLINKGVVQVNTVAGFAKGNAIYIVAATNVLTETGSGNLPYGTVVEVENQNGTPAGKVRIDLDLKPVVVA
jgi:hypothetical protein